MEKRAVIIKEKMELTKVVDCLEDLLTSLKAGTLCVQHGDDLVTLNPSAFVKLEIEASVKKGKESFSLELNWHNDKDVEQREFRIMSSEPAEEVTATS